MYFSIMTRAINIYETRGSAIAEGCATRLSVEILQLQNIAIVWHYLRDPTFSRFYKIPKCDRHAHTDRRTDRYTTTACTALSIASHGKNRPYCTTVNLYTNYEVSMFTHYEDMKSNEKCKNWGGLGVRGHPRSSET